jgi:hypothetical protein
MLKPAKLGGFMLQEEDLLRVWPEATQTDLDKVAEVFTDLLMDHWLSDLIEAVIITKRENGGEI